MALSQGTRLGPYEILAPIGAGGMGEVYRARDSRIGREIAIKVLPSRFASDPDRLRRFEQEARAIAALNHPNILTIHDVGTHEGAPYLVSELLEGATLREGLAEGLLPFRKAIECAVGITHGLAAAHEKGIVHRDLKPENIFLTRDGRVKILDFGLAKLTEPEGRMEGDAETVTLSAATKEGTILGTVGYMSPEQVRGERADHRTDVFSFGAVLHEMLSGQRAFRGNSTVETLNAILKESPPPVSDTSPAVPAGLDRVVRRCLEKSLEQRFQSAKDLGFAIENAAELPSQAAAEERPGRRRAMLAAGLAVGATLLPGTVWLVRNAQDKARASTPTFRQLTFRLGNITGARFAPDGNTVVYSAAWEGEPLELFTTRIQGPESRRAGLPRAGILAISSLGEMAISMGCELNWGECQGTLARVPLAGGAPREVLEDVDYADWSPDGKELAVVRGFEGLYRLEFPIGKVLYQTPGWITYPRFSPKGDRIAFLDHVTLGDTAGEVAVVDLAGNKKTLSAGWKNLKGMAWAPAGDEVWFTATRVGRHLALYGVTLSGGERLVLRVPGSLHLRDISREGRLLLIRVDVRSRMVYLATGTGVGRDLSWFDWSTTADLSPDGKTLLFYEWGEGVGASFMTYLRKTDGSEAVRLGEGRAWALSADGKWALVLQASSKPQLVLLPTGPGQPKTLPNPGIVEYYSAAWFPDGRQILFVGEGPGRRPRSYLQNLDSGETQPLTPEGFLATLVSPDGGRVAGYGPEGGHFVCWVSGGEPAMVGLEPGDRLVQWSADGASLYVRAVGSGIIPLYRVDLTTGRRTLWKQIEPADRVGTIAVASEPTAVRLTPDGKSCVYSYWKALQDLNLAEGLR